MKLYLISLLLISSLLLGGMGAFALQQDNVSSQAGKNATPNDSQSSHQNKPVTGEEVFEANCARCHTPPMTISPRVTGTIIMHMRVRARLSRQDEQLLLKYMAP
jgi:cytochrome c5